MIGGEEGKRRARRCEMESRRVGEYEWRRVGEGGERRRVGEEDTKRR